MKTKIKQKDYKQTELGLLPEDWKVVRVKDIAKKMKAGGTPRRSKREYWENGNIPFALIEDMTSCGLYLSKTKETITEEGLKNSSAWLIPINSLLLSMYATIGETAVNMIPLAANQAILAIIPKDNFDVVFGAYLLKFNAERLKMQNIQSTQKNINKGIVENFKIPLPPLDEQKKIAFVLSTIQTAKEKTEQVIKVLKEFKKSLMNHLFTYGPVSLEEVGKVKLKETELGLLPEDWKVVKLGDVVEYNLGRTPPRKEKKYWNDGIYPWVSISDMKEQKIINYTKEKISKEAFEKVFKKKISKKGTLLMSFKLTIGRTSILGIDAVHNEAIISINPNKNLDKIFLFYYLPIINYSNYVDKAVKGNTLNKSNLNNIKIPLPPLDEQKKIASILSVVDGKIQAEENKKNALEELFKSMLHNLMTAKIRVNNLVVKNDN